MAKPKETKSPVDLLYAAFQRAENKVGGGEGLVGIYGSMTQQGTDNIMRAMAARAGLDERSTLVDIGAGLCRPLLHAAVQCNVQRTYGVELDAVKCQKAVPFVQHVVSQLSACGVKLCAGALPTIICASVEQLGSLEPATHAYAAWEGFPVQAKMAVGALFSATPSLHTITIVQRSLRCEDPAEVMADLGFGSVRLIAPAIPVSIAGSQRRLNAYIFTKTSIPTACHDNSDKPTASEPCFSACTRAHTSASSAAMSMEPHVGGQHTGVDVRGSRGGANGTEAPQQQQHCSESGSRGGGVQGRALPDLASAAPFHPAAVMEALARMGAEEGAAMSTSDPGPAIKRARQGAQDSPGNTHSAHLDLSHQHEYEQQQQQQQQQQRSPVSRQHGHGLRSHRRLSMRALQGMQAESDGDDDGVGREGPGLQQADNNNSQQGQKPHGLRRHAQLAVHAPARHATQLSTAEHGERLCGTAAAAATAQPEQRQQQREQQHRHSTVSGAGRTKSAPASAAVPAGLQRVLREGKPRSNASPNAPAGLLIKPSQLSSSSSSGRKTRSSMACASAGVH